MGGNRLTMDDVTGPHGGSHLVTAGAPAAAAEVAVVGLHGRGATAEGFLRVCEEFYRHGVTYLLPAAFRSTWYPRGFDEPLADNEPDLSSAVDCVRFALDRAASAGIEPDHTVVVGFSQGACVAAEFAVRNPRRYGGIAILSGALPGESGESRSLESGSDRSLRGDDRPLDGTPVLLGCDEDDPNVPVDRIHATTELLRNLGADVDERIYDEADHAVTDDELSTIGGWIDSLLKNGDAQSSSR